MNNNFFRNKKGQTNHNIFNKGTSVIINNRDDIKLGASIPKNNNINTIHYINNNSINLTNLNVNLNVNLNNHSRNLDKNIDLLDKITLLKRSVDKYTEEAKKKFESQLLRNTINNEPLININNFNGNTIFRKVDPISVKTNNVNNSKK